MSLLLAFPAPFAALEERASDFVWRLTASKESERRVVVVDIDEASLQRLGGWPWPRERVALLSDRLAEAGAALQVFDIVFPAPGAGDERLLSSLQRNHGVISQVFAIQGSNAAQQGQVSSALDWPACPAFFPVSESYIANAPQFEKIPAGHITPLVAEDGSVRKQPALICFENKPYPALFMKAAMQGGQSSRLSVASGSGLLGPAWQIQGLGIGSGVVPLDAAGNVRIPWLVHPDALTAVSAQQVLAGDYPAELFENAWVLIGSSALGVNDRVATPFTGLGAGLQVHAQLLLGVLEDRIPVVPRLKWLFPLLVILSGGGLFVFLRRSRPIAGLIVGAVVLVVVTYLIKAWLLTRYSLWVEWLPGSLYLVLLALILSVVEHARSRVERDRIYAHLSSYLPAPVAAALAVRDPSGAIDAARRNVIAVYADIRNFSAYCEVRPPEETTAVLHALISAATMIVEKHGGMVQSIHGDGILAIWSGPEESADAGAGAEHALQAARELLVASRHILPDPDPGHLQSLALGIGLESGPATVGSFGLARRRTHLAMGRAITLAVRLEQMTVELAHPILIGENLAAYLGQYQLESQGVFLLEGIVSPCHIYAYPLRNCV